MNWYKNGPESAIEKLNTNNEVGLSITEEQAHLAKHGTNELVEKGGRAPLQIFWAQLTETICI